MSDKEKSGVELLGPEVVGGTALMQLEKASIDMQVATAHQYPRSMTVFKKRAVDMATLDDETAESCIYRRPVGGGKMAEGMSVRMAEIVGACYGNLRVASRVIEQNERYVVAQGVAHDLESNFMSSCEVIESTVGTNGQPYSERMRIVVAKAALAKARRDATFQVVPKALCKPVEKAVRSLLYGDGQPLETRRERVEARINKMGIEPERVYRILGVSGIDDVGAKEMEAFSGVMTAVKDGDTTIDEAFPLEAETVDETQKHKDEAEEKRAKALNARIKKIAPDMLKADFAIVKQVFGDRGTFSEKTDEEEATIDLMEQMKSASALEAMYLEVKKAGETPKETLV
jgi:hypothetical protein